jgi:TusA-related sulfurtransferase
MAEFRIDAKGLQCPGPIMRLFIQMKTAKAGDLLIIEVTDPGFKSDVEIWCRKLKHDLLSISERDGVITAEIRKG